jgi:hypothetical protein
MYGGHNLDHIYHMHFCPKNSRFMLDYNPQNAFHMEMFGAHFLEHSHTCESVLKSWDILPTCIFLGPKLGCEPTTRIMTNVDMVYKVSMGMYSNM